MCEKKNVPETESHNTSKSCFVDGVLYSQSEHSLHHYPTFL